MLLTEFILSKTLAYGIYFQAVSPQRQVNAAPPIVPLFSRPSTAPFVFPHFEVRRECLAAFRALRLIDHIFSLMDVATPYRCWAAQIVINNRKIAAFARQ
jgi:hypothetical protein